MKVKEIQAKSILRKHKHIDSWFVSKYGMNLYRGCTHNCVYCDGRAEKYNVDGIFGKEVAVKTNAIQLLRKELNPPRSKLDPGYIMVGGGVGDSYQPVEKQYKLTRKTLELLHHYKRPISILTKSTLVERDLDLIKKINEVARSIVSFSFSSVDEEISSIFEPGVPSPKDRLETIKTFKEEGIACGMFLMPVIPFVTDKPKFLEDSIKKAKNVGVDFVLFSGMTMKDGRQRDYFYDVMKENYPGLLVEYNNIYQGDKYGSATPDYYESIHKTFSVLIKEYKISPRIPSFLFKDLLKENDRITVILGQLDYLCKLNNRNSPYSYAAYSISKLDKPISTIRNDLQKLKGVGPTTEKIILEILDTGTSSYYEKLMG